MILVINIFDQEGEDEFGGVEVEGDIQATELKHMVAEALRERFGDKVKINCTFN